MPVCRGGRKEKKDHTNGSHYYLIGCCLKALQSVYTKPPVYLISAATNCYHLDLLPIHRNYYSSYMVRVTPSSEACMVCPFFEFSLPPSFIYPCHTLFYFLTFSTCTCVLIFSSLFSTHCGFSSATLRLYGRPPRMFSHLPLCVERVQIFIVWPSSQVINVP